MQEMLELKGFKGVSNFQVSKCGTMQVWQKSTVFLETIEDRSSVLQRNSESNVKKQWISVSNLILEQFRGMLECL